MIDPSSLKVTELKAELTARGLSTKGVKKDLVERLEQALSNDGTVTGSATEPDVASKDVDMNKPMDGNTSTVEQAQPTTQEEAKEIAQITPPITQPVAAAAEGDIIMTVAPVPAPESVTEPASSVEGVQATTTATVKPDPVEKSSELTREGLIDTTMAEPSVADQPSTDSKKRSLNFEDTAGAEGNDEASESKETPAKRQKAIAINRDGNEQVIAAAKESLEADARRRSTAPSPSPIPPTQQGHTASTSAITEESKTQGEVTDSEQAGSTEDKKPTSAERRDPRSQFQRQVQLAALGRKSSTALKSSIASPTATSASTTTPESVQSEGPIKDTNPTAKRALTITNFVRPLVVSQVKRLLSESGEIEKLWLDNIKTHCYVIFKEEAEAEKAYKQTDNLKYPPETGKNLKPYFITSEAAYKSIAAAEEAQKAGKRPVIYTGQEPLPTEKPKAVPKPKAPIVVQKDEAKVIFKRAQVQVVQPTELFSMTKAKPMLYYKAVKEPPSASVPASVPASASAPESTPA
ncbi:hypothetical protein FBU30_004144 [Linnemannia zychae]|nr:hypothetical protein FBU30_004144 [Linnemannia zychae]